MKPALVRAASAAALLVLASAPGRAQDPVRPPAAKTTAPARQPGPRRLVGIVVDTAGNPIAGAEVIVPDMVQRLLTGVDGTFRVDSIPEGAHLIRARKLGYAQRIREAIVDSTGGVILFTLTPVVTALPAVVSSANRRGLSGYISDIASHSVEGATVQVLGAGLTTRTEADGSFFLPAPAGSYMVSVKKDSFATKLVSVRIPRDSGRQMNASLQRFNGKIPKDEYWNVDELRERAAWIPSRDRTFFSHEDLVRLKFEWVYDAVVTTTAKFNAVASPSRDCPAIVNGGPAAIPISMLTVDDVESVEIYRGYPIAPPPTLATRSKSKYSKVPSPVFLNPTAKSAMRTMKSNGAPGTSTEAVGCLGVYVWMR